MTRYGVEVLKDDGTWHMLKSASSFRAIQQGRPRLFGTEAGAQESLGHQLIAHPDRQYRVVKVENQTKGPASLMGTCQWCFSVQQVPRGRMALHGYRRPGGGAVIGRCPGSGDLPFEQSHELTDKLRLAISANIDREEKRVAMLRGRPASFHYGTREYDHRFGRNVTVAKEMISGDPFYPMVLHEQIALAVSNVQMETRYFASVDQRLQNWAPRELIIPRGMEIPFPVASDEVRKD